ncbi:hypothetical protein DM02DRAFT_222606, partial [Periconia macrospinosa]
CEPPTRISSDSIPTTSYSNALPQLPQSSLSCFQTLELPPNILSILKSTPLHPSAMPPSPIPFEPNPTQQKFWDVCSKHKLGEPFSPEQKSKLHAIVRYALLKGMPSHYRNDNKWNRQWSQTSALAELTSIQINRQKRRTPILPDKVTAIMSILSDQEKADFVKALSSTETAAERPELASNK